MDLLCWILIGIILGNASTTFIYRIPLGIPISGFEKKPFCGGCGISLKPLEFLPLIRYFLISKFCRCGKYPIPKLYPIIEIAGGIMAAITYLVWKESELLPLKLILFITILIAIAIYIKHGRIFENNLWILLFVGTVTKMYHNIHFDPLIEVGLAFMAFITANMIFKSLDHTSLDVRFATITIYIGTNQTFAMNIAIFILSFIFTRYLFNRQGWLCNVIAMFGFLCTQIVGDRYVNF